MQFYQEASAITVEWVWLLKKFLDNAEPTKKDIICNIIKSNY